MVIIDINNCLMETIMCHPEFKGVYWGAAQQADLFKVCMIACRNPDIKIIAQRDENVYIRYQQLSKNLKYRLT